MKIRKKLNNNVVIAVNKMNVEFVLVGKGLAYGKTIHDEIETAEAEKVFKIRGKGVAEKLSRIIEDIPLEHVKVCDEIINFAKRELKEELNEKKDNQSEEEHFGLVEAFHLLIANKFYLMICGVYILQQLYGAMINSGIYYMTYVLKNENLYGVFSWAFNIPLIIALIFTPTLVGKWKGMYKLNLRGYIIAVIGRALVVVAGYIGSVPLMLAFTALAALGQGPWQGDMNAVIASCSEYTFLTKGKRVDGTMYSCTSLGVKLGGGLGTAAAGWLLEFSKFDGTLAVQPESCINMLHIMYLWIPLIINVIIMLILSRMNVEGANAKIKAEKGLV